MNPIKAWYCTACTITQDEDVYVEKPSRCDNCGESDCVYYVIIREPQRVEQPHKLDRVEKDHLRMVAERDETTTILLWGDGEHRHISLYAEGTRLEARIAYPEATA